MVFNAGVCLGLARHLPQLTAGVVEAEEEEEREVVRGSWAAPSGLQRRNLGTGEG